MRRRLGIAALVALALLGLAGAIGWFVWLPSAVEARLVEVASRRGLTVSLGGLDAGVDSVELRTLELRGRDALRIQVDRVTVGAGLWELATDGRAAIRRVTTSGVRLSLDVSDEEAMRGVLRDLRGAPSATAEGPTAARPAIDVERLEITVRQGEHILLTLSGGEAQLLAGDVVRFSSAEIAVAPGDPEGATIASTSLRLHEDDERGWQIDSLVVRDAELTYREREAEVDSPVWDRLRGAARRVGAVARDAVGERSDTGSEDEGAAEPDAEPSRLAAIAEIARAIAPRLALGAELRLEGLDVVALSDEGSQRVLRELRSEARALPEGRYRLEGEGRPGRGGRLAWDLRVDPDALRAEGNVNFQRLPFVLLAPFLPDLPWYRPEDATLTGDLTIRGDSASSVHLEGEASIADLALSSPRIAPTPVRRIAASFRGQAEWLPLSRRLEVASATIGLGQAEAQLSGSLEWPEDHFLVDGRITLPPTDCNTAIGAIPADLLAELNGFTFRGRIGGQVVVRVDSRDLDATRLDIDVADGCTFVTAPAMADVSRFSTSFVHRVVEPDGTQFQMETGPETLHWTPIAQISPFMVQAVLGHEDAGFFGHSGFSVPSIRLALIRNLREERYVYGASTITMQLVKNVFLHREKTLARKVQEVLLTWWVESVMEKRDILELYLNVIEYGPEIYGIRAAAMHYFGRSPAMLGPAESAYLATILPNPKGYHSHWEDGAVPPAFQRRVARFLRTLGSRGRYDEEAVAFGLERLEVLRFHREGEPVSLPPENRGHTAPLPIETGLGVEPDGEGWEEEPLEEEREGFDEGEPDEVEEGW